MAAQRQSSERQKAAVKLRVDSGLCFAQEVQPPGYNSVAGRLDELAGLLGCVTRHKHLAGRLGKRKLAEWKFGFLITVFFISTHMSANDLTSLWTAFVSLFSKMEM